MLKPVGGACNLRCSYCYYRRAESPEVRLSAALVEAFWAGYLPHAPDTVSICWQGGEPTLAGWPFFEQALASQQRHVRPNQTVQHALMTNGTRLDEAWCAALARHKFLVGLSLDGALLAHDRYRHNDRGQGSFDQVVKAVARLRQHNVPYNLLTVVSAANVAQPDVTFETLATLCDGWLQFIPAVEWAQGTIFGKQSPADFVVSPEAYGEFLIAVFDRWLADPSRLSVRLFESLLSTLVLGQASVCTEARACDTQLTVEADGSIYACDHFVSDQWRLGQVVAPAPGTLATWMETLDRSRLGAFAARKTPHDSACLCCRFYRFCFGGCPKHRPNINAPTFLCAATQRFLTHALPHLDRLAAQLRSPTRAAIPQREYR